MATVSFSLAELFQQTFGYKSKAFDPKFPAVIGEGDSLSGRREQGSSGSPYYATDALGREYYIPITVTYNDASVLSDNNKKPEVLTRWNLPYPVVSVTSKKTIVETPMTERRGTVKELINVEDYEIIVKGFLIERTHEFPETDAAKLRSIYELNTPVSISCPLTDIFLLRPEREGSDKVVITELKFPALPGVKNVRPYELKMISDQPFNLVEIKK